MFSWRALCFCGSLVFSGSNERRKKRGPMSDRRSGGWSRREFLTKATLAGAAGIFGVKPNSIAAEPPPETTRLKILDLPRGICPAPQYVAEELLRSEGFTELQYLRKQTENERFRAVATGEAHMFVTFVPSLVSRLDAGGPAGLPGRFPRGMLRAIWSGARARDSGPPGQDGGDCRRGIA